jgi:hypothetical protein
MMLYWSECSTGGGRGRGGGGVEKGYAVYVKRCSKFITMVWREPFPHGKWRIERLLACVTD